MVHDGGAGAGRLAGMQADLDEAEVRRGDIDLYGLLAAVEAAPPVAAAEVVGRHLAEVLDATEVSLLVADLSGRALVRLGRGGAQGSGARRQGDESAERVGLDTPAGRALERQALEVTEEDEGTLVHAPVTNRGDVIGVLELRLPRRPEEAELRAVAAVAHALAYVVIANRRFTDLFDWGQRSIPLSLAAEIQQRLLPDAYTLEAGQATVAGWLQPAGTVAGDTFDFSLERDTLHLSLTDAMGHRVDAALMATALMGALRKGRRGGATLAEQATQAGEALVDCLGGIAFATGQLVRVDLAGGTAEIVNAGHPWPLRLRDGEVTEVRLEAEPPFGAVDHQYHVQPLDLRPGDRLLFVTDGVLDRNAAALDLAAHLRATADLHVRDAVQALMRALLDATGEDIQDDATVLGLDWHGAGHEAPTASAGADD
jgi:serine phosphatase RsbU (regulator of sigma subunit)